MRQDVSVYILSDERDSDPVGAFAKYREFLEENSDIFPKGAFELATSDWYYNFEDHRCPHDSWLEELLIQEPYSGERNEVRATNISMRLLGAYHDGHISISYQDVYSYEISGWDVSNGHSDWRYDEFRLDKDGRLLHEIEWCGSVETAKVLIVAKDIQFTWIPLK